MTENTTITVSKDQHSELVTTNGYLVIYLKGEDFKFIGDLSINDLAPMLMKFAMEKMVHKD